MNKVFTKYIFLKLGTLLKLMVYLVGFFLHQYYVFRFGGMSEEKRIPEG